MTQDKSKLSGKPRETQGETREVKQGRFIKHSRDLPLTQQTATPPSSESDGGTQGSDQSAHGESDQGSQDSE